MKLVFLVMFILLLLPSVMAIHEDDVYSIRLLAVSELENGTTFGTTAQMQLQVRDGKGSVFIETFPNSRIDTQVATTIANEIACEFSDVDCSRYDFFYTIRAESSTIGGPSAGGATALLTLAALEDVAIPDDVAMTGAIGSGGVIIPVSGVKEKLFAAQRDGLSTVIVPGLTNNSNVSQYNLSIRVIPVITLEDALSKISTYKPKKIAVMPPPEYYVTKMKQTAIKMCARSKDLLRQIKDDDAFAFYNRSKSAFIDGDYYSAASLCYSASTRARTTILQNYSLDVLKYNFDRLNESVKNYEEQVDGMKLETFSDLETYIIVKERLLETKQYLERINQSNISVSVLGVAIERYYSAVIWSKFFGVGGKKLHLEDDVLRLACIEDLTNVESRLNYLEFLFSDFFLSEIQADRNKAYEYYGHDEYALCLFKANLAKARADVLLSSAGAGNESVQIMLEAKQRRAAEQIATAKVFPILGYSYLEYANRLRMDEPYTAFLFTEYALTLSDMSVYFPEEKGTFTREEFNQLIAFGFGILVGGVLIGILMHKPQKKSTKKKPKRRK